MDGMLVHEVDNYGWQTNKDVNTIRLNIWDPTLNGMLKVPAVPVSSGICSQFASSGEALGFAKLDVTPGDTLRAHSSEKQWWMEMAQVSQVFSVQAHVRLSRHGQDFMSNAPPVHHVTLAAGVIIPAPVEEWRGGQCCHFEQSRLQSSWSTSLAPHRQVL